MASVRANVASGRAIVRSIAPERAAWVSAAMARVMARAANPFAVVMPIVRARAARVIAAMARATALAANRGTIVHSIAVAPTDTAVMVCATSANTTIAPAGRNVDSARESQPFRRLISLSATRSKMCFRCRATCRNQSFLQAVRRLLC